MDFMEGVYSRADSDANRHPVAARGCNADIMSSKVRLKYPKSEEEDALTEAFNEYITESD